jgi:septal ring factor EnvC (AmiA/AmiB activator)
VATTETQIESKATGWLLSALKLLLPLAVSAFVAYGAASHARGAEAERLSTVERDVRDAKSEHDRFVTRDEFGLLREDISDIKTDVRELRRGLSK